MKYPYYYFIALAIASAAAFFIIDPMIDPDRPMKAAEDPSSIKDRSEWLLMRLRDPATGKIPGNIHRAELKYALSLPGSIKNIKTKFDRTLANRWSQSGPVNIGGRTRAFATDISNENIMLAGGVSGGMWRSVNSGATWTRTTRPEQFASVSCLTQDIRPGKQNVWYYGTGELIGNSEDINGDGIYKSTDGGLSWYPLPSTVKNTPQSWDNSFEFVWSIVSDHTNLQQDELYAAYSAGGIMRSTDGGSTWSNVLGGFSNTGGLYTDIVISPNGVLYATISQETFGGGTSGVKGIFRSTDGLKWDNITPANFPMHYKRIVIGIAPSEENQVYFFGETPDYGMLTINSQGDSLWHSIWKYTYKSGDGKGEGGIWEDRSLNLPTGQHWRAKVNSQYSYNLCVKVKPDNPDVVFIGHASMHRSDDGFKTTDRNFWIGGYNPDTQNPDYRYPNHHPDVHTLFFKYSDPNVLLTGSDGGVHMTTDCMANAINWIDLNNGYFTTQFYSVAIDHATPGSNEILGGTQDNSTLYTKWDNVNTPWTIPTSSDGFCCAIPDGGNEYYYSQNSSYQPKIKIWRLILDDNGNYVQRTRIDPIGGKDFIWNTPFLLDPNDNSIMYLAGGNIVWRNNDLSKIPAQDTKDSTSIGWDSLSNTRVNDAKVTALGISKSPANILFYGTANGKIFRVKNANTGNPVPEDISGKNFPGNAYAGCIAVDPENADKIFVVFTNYNILSIFYTEDGGKNWTPVSGNLEERVNGSGAGPAVFWLEMMKVNGRNMYFAGTSTGVYSTAFISGMNTVWQQEGAETIGNVVVDMLDARESDGFIVAGTHGLGTFTAKITDIPQAPVAATLIKPANGTAGIKYETVLEWTPVANAGSYMLEVSTDPDFNTILTTVDGIKGTTYKLGSVINPGRNNYYWRVYAISSGGMSAPSETWYFTSVIESPKLASPANSSTEMPLTLDLSWEPVPGATKYHLQVSKTFGFSELIVDKSDIITNSYSLSDLEKGKKYYWRVAAIDNDGESDFSGHFNFKTTNNTSVKENPENNIVLMQSYPNPSNGNSVIGFSIPANGWVTLKLYDRNGREVSVIIDKYLEQGSHTVKLNTGSLPQGEYFYRLNFGGSSLSRSLTILR